MFPTSPLCTSDANTQTVALVGERTVTRAAFAAEALALAGRFAAHPAQTWALYCEETYPFTVALFALLRANKKIVIPSNNTAGVGASLDGLCDARYGNFPVTTALPEADALAPQDIAADHELIIYTSGSTGEPKAIRKYWRQLTAEVSALDQLWGADLTGCHVLGTVSHQHIYGLLFRVLWPLVAGGVAVSHCYRDPTSVLAVAASGRDCCWVASPAQLKRVPLPAGRSSDYIHLKAIFSSGGPLPEDTARSLSESLGRAPVEIFGSSESGGIAWRQSGTRSYWRALPGVKLDCTTQGALLVRSPFLPDNVPLRMEDQVRFQADGSFELGARMDRVVKIEEKRLSLPELEQRLIQSGLVHNCRALVLGGIRQQVAVVVELNAAGAQTLQACGSMKLGRQLRRYLADYFEAVTLPRRWRFVDSMPMNSQGKITQQSLQSLFEDVQAPILPLLLDQQVEDARITVRLLIPENLAYLPGHFPGTPILPGVVQINWAEHFGRQLLGVMGKFSGMDAIKFKRLVTPGLTLTLTLEYNREKGRLSFNFLSDRGEHSSGHLRFEGAHV